eukprot:snap_masked-scaffold_25-processed-gene-4.35-mRNA-1 protein AED:1.00 eAED:1.00 QI:0/-1/0/0/-1/1/1/0/87
MEKREVLKEKFVGYNVKRNIFNADMYDFKYKGEKIQVRQVGEEVKAWFQQTKSLQYLRKDMLANKSFLEKASQQDRVKNYGKNNVFS